MPDEMESLTDLERLGIIESCQRQINRYARLNDAADFTALAALFTEDGTFARPSEPDKLIRGRAAILDAFKSRPPRPTCHIVSNIEIDVESRCRARAFSRIVLYIGHDQGNPPDILSTFVGTFQDVLVRVCDSWLFQERRGGICLRIISRDATQK